MSSEGNRTSNSESSSPKADQDFFRLTQVYLRLYHLSRSPLGKLLRIINGIYTLATLRPHRTTAYISLIKEADAL